MRNIKMLGLLAVSAMALVALVGASSASAHKFTAGVNPEPITETTTVPHVFTVQGSEVACANAEFTGETTGKEAESQEVSPTYTECEAFGFAGATVNTGTCDFVFSGATTGTPPMADVTLKGCANSTQGVVITVNLTPFAHCVVDVPHQTVKTAVGYENTGAKSVKVTATATGIMADVTTSAGFCPLTTGTTTTGTYNGVSDITTANGVQIS